MEADTTHGEADPNPMPYIDLFPRVTKVVRFLFSRHNQEPFPAMSDHYKETESTAENIGQLALFDVHGIHRDSIVHGDDW